MSSSASKRISCPSPSFCFSTLSLERSLVIDVILPVCSYIPRPEQNYIPPSPRGSVHFDTPTRARGSRWRHQAICLSWSSTSGTSLVCRRFPVDHCDGKGSTEARQFNGSHYCRRFGGGPPLRSIGPEGGAGGAGGGIGAGGASWAFCSVCERSARFGRDKGTSKTASSSSPSSEGSSNPLPASV